MVTSSRTRVGMSGFFVCDGLTISQLEIFCTLHVLVLFR